MNLKERCRVSEKSLPPAPYRERLVVLHDKMLDRIAYLESQLKALKGEREWISVEDRLPDNGFGGFYPVLVSREGAIDFALFNMKTGNFQDKGFNIMGDVLHWRNLPSPPQVK